MTVKPEDVGTLLSGYSLEVTPASAARIERFQEYLPPGTTVNVTFLSSSSDIDEIVLVSERLRAEGFNPVPHIAARNIESEVQLENYLAALRKQAAVDEVLVIGGGAAVPVGPYPSTMHILKSGLLESYGIRKIGVAGHPEGSPDISAAELSKALSDKNMWAKKSGLDVYIETQFCFSASAIMNWERRIRSEGNQLPIHIGLPGVTSIKTLMKFAQISGVGPSLEVLRRQARNVAKLVARQEPDSVVAGVATARASDPDCLINRVHFYTFGGIKSTAAWASAAAAGKIIPKADGGFRICQ